MGEHVPNSKRPARLSEADYKVIQVTAERIVIVDLDTGPSVTNEAERVIDDLLHEHGYLPERRYFYRDTMGVFDELVLESGRFSRFAACTLSMRSELAKLAEGVLH